MNLHFGRKVLRHTLGILSKNFVRICKEFWMNFQRILDKFSKNFGLIFKECHY
jgi:hypothetical protein